VSRWTGIPVTRLQEAETARLLRMEDEMHETVVGQDEAIAVISRAIRRSRAGLKDPKRPIGSFIFSGPRASARPSWRARSPASCSPIPTR